MSAQASPPVPSREHLVELDVEGMTCGACSARVERALNGIVGVTASVNYATGKARVGCPAEVAVQSLLETVEHAGYTASVHHRRTTGGGEADRDSSDTARVKALWPRLIVAMLLVAPVGDLSIVLVLAPDLRFPGWQWALLALTVPVVTWCAWPFHRAALRAARHGTTTMDTLVSLGVVTAAGWSLYTIFFRQTADEVGAGGAWGLLLRPSGSIYLEVCVGVTTLMLAGRLMEAQATRRAGDALRGLASAGAKEVCIVRADGGEEWVPVDDLEVGDVFVVRPGELLATDGEVVQGFAGLDTSAMTGESAPFEAGVGQQVLGGTLNLDGRLLVRATHTAAQAAHAQLVELVERAQGEKAAVQRLADRVSSVFVPTVIVLAALTFLGWLLLGPGSVAGAIGPALSVLIIACPCALGLATPTALMVSAGRGAQLGVFVKTQQALESARAIDTVVLDKTGTLTSGELEVVEVFTVPGVDRTELLTLVGALEHASEHPIARAISVYAEAATSRAPAVVEEFCSLPGLGAQGTVGGRTVMIGSDRLVGERGARLPEELRGWTGDHQARGATVVLAVLDGTACGGIALLDTVKPSAAVAVRQLRQLGLRTVLLTGDNSATANAVAAQLEVDEVVSQVLPADKATVVERMRAAGHTVAMVGDGINDGPALAAADLGMAVITGADVAIDAADLLLVRDDLRVIPTSVRLARATLRIIRGNLVWAFGYNVAALPLAAAGLLNPLVAAAAMAFSSLFVVTNSLRLRRFVPSPGLGDAAASETSKRHRPSTSTRGSQSRGDGDRAVDWRTSVSREPQS